jgi:hypothetical protein
MKSFITCILHEVDDGVKEDEKERACSTYGREKECM